MNGENETLQTTSDLSSIFPDIEEQLCSRHSTVMGKLNQTFKKLYDNMTPKNYIVVKGTTTIMKTQQISLSFALENGIILLVTPTFQTSNIFLNSNHMDQEIIFTHTGTIQQGLHELNQQLQNTFKLAISNLQQQNLFGGIIYLHANISQQFFSYKNSFLLAFYLSILLINGQIQKISIENIILNLVKSGVIDDIDFLEKQFYDFQNRQFCLTVGNQTFKMPLRNDLKLVFCRLGLASSDLEHIENKLQMYREEKNEILQQLNKNYQINSFHQAFTNQLPLHTLQTSSSKRMIMQVQMEQLQTLCDFSNKQIQVEKLLQMSWQIDSEIKKIYPDEVLELVQDLKEKTGVKVCSLVQKEFLIMVVDRKRFTELISMLSHFLLKGELKSKSCFHIDEELVEHRWGSDDQIREKIFASAPSSGVLLFDPSQSIWFD